MSQPSLMPSQANQALEVIMRLFRNRAGEIAKIGRWLTTAPPVVVTLKARGSSGHAATFFRYLMQARACSPTAEVMPNTGSGLIDPLVGLLPCYRMIEAVARMRGFDPDKPRNLMKVTETV